MKKENLFRWTIYVIGILVLAMGLTLNTKAGLGVSAIISVPYRFTKNCFDLFNICITVTIGLVFVGKIVGAGIGTVCAVIAVGRVIAVFNHFFMDTLLQKAGLRNEL